MNGATALPFARTITPPKSAIISSTGISQYFRRARIKLQSSMAKSSMMTSKLVRHRGCRRTGRPSLDPVRRRLGIETQPQGILAERAQYQPDRCHGREEDQTEHDWAHAPVEEQADPEPDAVERREQRGRGRGKGHEDGCHGDAPPANWASAEQRPARDDREDRREHEAELSITRPLDVLIPRVVLVALDDGLHLPSA